MANNKKVDTRGKQRQEQRELHGQRDDWNCSLINDRETYLKGKYKARSQHKATKANSL